MTGSSSAGTLLGAYVFLRRRLGAGTLTWGGFARLDAVRMLTFHPAAKHLLPYIGGEMADATAVFFDDLARRGHEPLLGDAVGSVRFELAGDSQTETWRLTLDNGDVSVSRDESGADCIVRVDKKLFDGIAIGEVNAMAALLRGALVFEGDPELLVHVQRVFPSPAADRVAPGEADRR